MKVLVLITCLLHVCTGDNFHTPVDPINDNIPVSEDDDLNSVYKNPNNVKLSPSEDSVRNVDTPTTYIPIFSKKKTPDDGYSDPSDGRYTTKTSMQTVLNENTSSEIAEVRPISQEPETPGIYVPVLVVEKDSQLSDIPADEPVLPNSTETTILPGEQNPTVPSIEPAETTVKTVVEEGASTQEETSEGSNVPALGESSDQPEIGSTSRPESGEPDQTTEIPFSVDDMNRRKGSGSDVTTEKFPQPDTPPYPPLPSIPTDEEGILHPRPPNKGQLDIRISIPHIFHLSLGDTPDGRRRLGIQAPFFKLDLTKPLFKVFQK